MFSRIRFGSDFSFLFLAALVAATPAKAFTSYKRSQKAEIDRLARPSDSPAAVLKSGPVYRAGVPIVPISPITRPGGANPFAGFWPGRHIVLPAPPEGGTDSTLNSTDATDLFVSASGEGNTPNPGGPPGTPPVSPAPGPGGGEKRIPFVLVMNGNATCSNNPFGVPKYNDVISHGTFKTLIVDPKVTRYVYTCHQLGTSYTNPYYIRFDKPNEVKQGKLSDIVAVIEELNPPTLNVDMKVYGYSYGGPDAMRVSHDVIVGGKKDPATNKISVYYLATVDPIGHDCDLAQLTKKPCTTYPEVAPATKDEQKVLDENVKFWQHWYQIDSKAIHSDKTPSGYPNDEKQKQFQFPANVEDGSESHKEMMWDKDILKAFVDAKP